MCGAQGVLARSKDLKEAFGTDDVDEVVKVILAKGELQVSEKERDSHIERCVRGMGTRDGAPAARGGSRIARVLCGCVCVRGVSVVVTACLMVRSLFAASACSGTSPRWCARSV